MSSAEPTYRQWKRMSLEQQLAHYSKKGADVLGWNAPEAERTCKYQEAPDCVIKSDLFDFVDRSSMCRKCKVHRYQQQKKMKKKLGS